MAKRSNLPTLLFSHLIKVKKRMSLESHYGKKFYSLLNILPDDVILNDIFIFSETFLQKLWNKQILCNSCPGQIWDRRKTIRQSVMLLQPSPRAS